MKLNPIIMFIVFILNAKIVMIVRATIKFDEIDIPVIIEKEIYLEHNFILKKVKMQD